MIRIVREKNNRAVAVIKRLLIDTLTPVRAYHALAGDGDGFLLESIPGSYSFIGTFAAAGGIIVDETARPEWDNLPVFDFEFEAEDLPPFMGGYVGYLGYEMVRGVESLPAAKGASGFPQALLGRVETFMMFDHLRQGISLVHVITAEDVSDADALTRAAAGFDEIERRLQQDDVPQLPPAGGGRLKDLSISDEDYRQAVIRAREYIRAGDIMQVVLSRRMDLAVDDQPFDVYRRLRQINPSPYLFYIRLQGVTLIGSSPEVMVKLEDGEITALPIAGTRPRGKTPEQDRDLAAELLADAKERAEHLMLLDLARNDVGRVAEPGSVKVAEREQVKFYSHVMHIVSRVTGRKQADLDGIDVLKACFPAGTVSGAPKVRAMEIIAELEKSRRGPYAGAAGYISFNGNVDTGIAIRTIFMNAEQVCIQAGAGIVWDSDPQRELEETNNKLKALSAALGGIA